MAHCWVSQEWSHRMVLLRQKDMRYDSSFLEYLDMAKPEQIQHIINYLAFGFTDHIDI